MEYLIVLLCVCGYLLHRYLISKKATEPAPAEAAHSPYEFQVGTKDFNTKVLDGSHQTPIVVDFSADWCGPSQYLTSVLSELVEAYCGTFLLGKVDVDKNEELAKRYRVQSLPTVVLFQDGQIVDQFVGARAPHFIKFFLAKNGVTQPGSAVSTG